MFCLFSSGPCPDQSIQGCGGNSDALHQRCADRNLRATSARQLVSQWKLALVQGAVLPVTVHPDFNWLGGGRHKSLPSILWIQFEGWCVSYCCCGLTRMLCQEISMSCYLVDLRIRAVISWPFSFLNCCVKTQNVTNTRVTGQSGYWSHLTTH